jgi:peptide/nickel transport system substrate-binding protein
LGTAPARWRARADDTLNVAFSAEITTLDTYKETAREGLILSRLIQDSLLHRNEWTGELEPELAESYRIVDDKTLDFTLRKGIKFHDGSALTAGSIWCRRRSTTRAIRYWSAGIDNAEKTGDHSIRLRMKQPAALALEMLAGNIPIYPKAYYEKSADKMGVAPIGAGPYKLVCESASA